MFLYIATESVLLRLMHHKLEDIITNFAQLPAYMLSPSFLPLSNYGTGSLPTFIVNCNDLEQFISLVFQFVICYITVSLYLIGFALILVIIIIIK